MKRVFSWIVICTLLLNLLPAGAWSAKEPEFHTEPCVSSWGDNWVALRADGTVWTMGDNFYGQLGYPTEEQSTSAFAQVPGLERMTAVYAGSNYILALKADGSVWGWGLNSSNRLGEIDSPVQETPIQIPAGGLHFVKLSLSGSHIVGLTDDGQVYAWGAKGAGLREDTGTPTRIPLSQTGEDVVVDVSTSSKHTLALTENGQVYAWGENESGQLGMGDTVERTRPTLVEFSIPSEYGTPTGVAAVSGGSLILLPYPQDYGGGTALLASGTSSGLWSNSYTTFTRLSSVVLRSDSYAVCSTHGAYVSETGGVSTWGSSSATLGHSGTDLKSLELDPGPMERVYVSSGDTHLMAADGTLYQVTGTTSYRWLTYADTGEPFNLLQPTDYFRTTPKIVSGDGHTVALSANGTVWTWGRNDYGQLGDGTNTDRPYAVRVSGLEHVVDISAGGDTTMAYTADGTLWAWGKNDRGQLGTGDRVDSSLPREVIHTQLTALANGSRHSMALTTKRQVMIWGDNTYGQSNAGFVGDGDYVMVPRTLSLPKNIGAIAAGGNASLVSTALRAYSSEPTLNYTKTEVYRWGDGIKANAAKELTTSNIQFTSAVATNGYQYFCYTEESGYQVCWGGNGYGQLMLKHTDAVSSPTFSWSASYSKYIPSPSGEFTLGLKEGTQELFFCGLDPLLDTASGGEPAAIVQPALLLEQVTDAAAGLDFVAAIRADGSVWSRGANDRGQLGNGGTDDGFSEFSEARPVVKASGMPLSLAYSDTPLYSLRVTAEGGRGEITGTQTDDYAQGTAVTVTAAGNPGWIFSHWTAEGLELADPASPTLSFPMPAGAVSLTAVFDRDLPGMGAGGEFLTQPGAPDSGAVPISTAAELKQLGNDLDGSYVLTRDIDLSGTGSWTPIGTADAPFTGTLDGQGHVISGLTITGAPTCAGLFGVVGTGGCVKNLGLEQVDIALSGESWEASAYVGGIAAVMGDASIMNGGAQLSNCYVTGSVSADLTWCDLWLGGLVGRMAGEAADCSNLAELTGRTDSAGTLYLGGIAGEVSNYEYAYAAPSTVERCVNGGGLHPHPSSNEIWAGGIVGYLDSYGEIRQCYNNADLWLPGSDTCGETAWLGGIAGLSDSTITDCFNVGDVGADDGADLYATMACGGIVGQVFDWEKKTYAICDSTVARCFNTGRVVARAAGGIGNTLSAGGLVGSTALSSSVPSGAKKIYVNNCMVLSREISAYERGSACIVGPGITAADYKLPNFYLDGVVSSSGSSVDSRGAYVRYDLDWFKDPRDSVPPGFAASGAKWEWDFQQVWTTDEAWNDGLPYLRFLTESFRIDGYAEDTARVYSRMSAVECTVYAVSYDESGRMRSVCAVQTDLEAGMNEIALPLEQKGQEIKVLLLRAGNLKPLAHTLVCAN